MESRTMRLADIKPAEYNPRVRLTEVDHEYKALKASIDEFGLVVLLIVNKRAARHEIQLLLQKKEYSQERAMWTAYLFYFTLKPENDKIIIVICVNKV